MNNHEPATSHVQPAIPLNSGRRHHDLPYSQSAPQPPYPHPYPSYHHAISQHYHQHPQQWYPYQNVQPSISRQYQQYFPMLNNPYFMPHNAVALSTRPNPLQPTHSSSSVRLQHTMSPSLLPDRSCHVQTPNPVSIPAPNSVNPAPTPPPFRRIPFFPPLPWCSVPEVNFPPRAARRRRRRPPPQPSSIPVLFPVREELAPPSESVNEDLTLKSTLPAHAQDLPLGLTHPLSISATPTTSQAPSETDSTQPTTPSSAIATSAPSKNLLSPVSSDTARKPARVLPVVPYLPALPRSSKRQSVSIASDCTKVAETASTPEHQIFTNENARSTEAKAEFVKSNQTSKASLPELKPAPKSWADLVRSKALPMCSNSQTNGSSVSQTCGVESSKAGSLADVLTSFKIVAGDLDIKIAFLKPRGLVNTGNMCYMNAVLQVLMFCIPFYKLLDQISKQAAYSFKSDTPLVDAMVMFMHEFDKIDSAKSVDQLRLRLKANELEEYGDPFIPEFVYEVIRRLPKFSSMRRGHQQDAEEFLGFLLEEMHDECARTINVGTTTLSSKASGSEEAKVSIRGSEGLEESGWLEVGPKQKAAVTRSSGMVVTESPITKIFGGKLRSELRIPGAKPSVTLEPYQPLQLDIGSPHINNIIDALKGLTKSETLHGAFNSPRGPGNAATKQVFIETLPPVLILHLKRFQYDNTGGTQKIWKRIGYPLELEIPKEVFPPHRRSVYAAHGGLPRYHLIGVVYHHGKNASGGHYTVDVRRQDGREWIRLDDTVIQRVRSEDVAEGGNEEDPRVLAAALEQHSRDQNASSNLFDDVRERDEESAASEAGWSHVNGGLHGSNSNSRAWSGQANGTATPSSSTGKRTPVGRLSVGDNKVAYILIYQRI